MRGFTDSLTAAGGRIKALVGILVVSGGIVARAALQAAPLPRLAQGLFARYPHGVTDSGCGERRCDDLQEVDDIGADIGSRPQRDIDHAAFEQIPGAARPDTRILHRIDRDIRKDCDAEAQFHIGLADIGVDGAETDFGRDSRLLERIHHLEPSTMTRAINNDRICTDILKGQFLEL
jgi:hypothetical protein